jgi:hypothetical protein
VATFGDALRRLTDAATYLYEDHKRYWYSTVPTVTRLAEDLVVFVQLGDLNPLFVSTDRHCRSSCLKPGHKNGHGFLLACLVAVVGLAKNLSPAIEHAVEAANALRTVVRIAIATLGKPDTRTYCCLHHRPGFRL